MQENNFEGKVNRMMEGFKLEPSEKVWSNIQADINGTRTRFGRVPVALLTICFLFTTFFLHDLEQKRIGGFHSIASNGSATSTSETKIADNPDKEIKSVGSTKKSKRQSLPDNYIDLNITKIIGLQKNKSTQSNSTEPISKVKQEVNLQSDESQDETENIAVADNSKPDTVTQITFNSAVVKNETTTNDKEKSITKQENKTLNKKKESNWEFFAAVSGGKFYTANSYLGQVANAVYYAANPLYNNGSGIPSGGFISPSVVKPGLSFSATLKANRKLSNKTSLSFGLGYQYAGTYITTGQILSGSGRDNFAAGALNTYHNKYHFLQLPLQIQSMIGKGNKFPLSWNAGFVFSRLISTTALQFNREQGYYFKDNSYFNKTTIGVSGGLSIAILKNHKTQWLIGPQVYYSLTPVANNGWYDKTHYSFVGLQLQKKL